MVSESPCAHLQTLNEHSRACCKRARIDVQADWCVYIGVHSRGQGTIMHACAPFRAACAPFRLCAACSPKASDLSSVVSTL